MTNSQRLATIRKRIKRWITAASQSTDSEVDPKIIRESILIRDEFFVGRRFFTDSHRAVWFIEEDELKISDLDGQVLCVMTGSEIDEGMEDETAVAEDVDGHDPDTEPEACDRANVIEFPVSPSDDSSSQDMDDFRRAA